MYSVTTVLWNAFYKGMETSVECCGDSVDNTAEFQLLLPNLSVLVAISKGILAVKLCTNNIRFLTRCAG